MANKICFAQKLNEDEIFQIRMLEKRYNQTKNIFFKIDPQSLAGNDDKSSHILYREQGELTGYMLVSCFNNEEMECTTIVNDNKNVFLAMYKMLVERAKEKEIGKILFIIDRNDIFLADCIKDLGLHFSFAEYRMNFDETRFNFSQTGDIVVRDATCNDMDTIAYLDRDGFGNFPDTVETKGIDMRDIECVKIALLDDEIIGKIKVEEIDGIIGIYGFVVHPKCRGKGLGRKILNSVIDSLLETDYKKLYLEVNSENSIALSLYKSAGFDIQTMFNYYEYTLYSL